ncbi:unnamed protein product, partial [marine sediment metagenome]
VDTLTITLSGSNDFDYLLGCSTDLALGDRSLTCAVADLHFNGGIYSENLAAEFYVSGIIDDSENLPGEFEVGQGSVDLLGLFGVSQGSVDLLAFFQSQVVVDLLGEFVIRQETTVELVGEFVVRHTVPDPGKFDVHGPYPLPFPTAGVNPNCVIYPFQRKIWYVNGRHWVFCVSGAYFAYASSTDGITWDGPTNIRAAAWT